MSIGVSGGTIAEDAVSRMADESIIFHSPTRIQRFTGGRWSPRSGGRHRQIDFPNQINNVLAFRESSVGHSTCAPRRSRGR
jgi:malic enzyme